MDELFPYARTPLAEADPEVHALIEEERESTAKEATGEMEVEIEKASEETEATDEAMEEDQADAKMTGLLLAMTADRKLN